MTVPQVRKPKMKQPGVYVRLTDRRTMKTKSFTVDQVTVPEMKKIIQRAVADETERRLEVEQASPSAA